jgi:hypothetical protein
MRSFTSFTSGDVLTEGALGFGEIQKYSWRIELFITKLKQGLPFETTDGKTVTLQYPNDDLEKRIKEGETPPRGYTIPTSDGKTVTFSKLLKSAEFGGGSRGSGGGSDSTTATESAQCVYAQCIWDNPSTDFNDQELTAAYQKCKVDATLKQVLDIPQLWKDSSIKGAKLLYRALKKKDYTWYRGMGIQSDMEARFKSLNAADGRPFNNINKWTPADIWIVSADAAGKYDFAGARSLEYLNNELLKAFAARDVMGVSLKQIGDRATLTQVNFRKPFKDPVFKSTTFGKRGFFKAKDCYIKYNGGEVQFRTYPTFQCEIIGTTAKHGKVSGGDGPNSMMGKLMTQAGCVALEQQKPLLQLFRKDKKLFLDKFYSMYQNTGEKDMTREQFEMELKGKDDNWCVSKYLATQVMLNIKGREQNFLSLLIRYAKSESTNSAVHLKVK